MSNLQKQIDQRVAEFVADITALAKQAAVETLEQSLGKANVRSQLAGGFGGSGKRFKRTSRQLVQTMAGLLEHINNNPGQRMEDISSGLGVTSKELALPIRKLLADGKIKTKGQRRATSYFVTARGGKAAEKAAEKQSVAPKRRRGRPRKKS